jgi:hypothetical protein
MQNRLKAELRTVFLQDCRGISEGADCSDRRGGSGFADKVEGGTVREPLFPRNPIGWYALRLDRHSAAIVADLCLAKLESRLWAGYK